MTPPQPRRQSIILRHAQHFSESVESPVQLKGCSNLRSKVSNDKTHKVSRISFGLQNLTGARQSSSEILYFDGRWQTANFWLISPSSRTWISRHGKRAFGLPPYRIRIGGQEYWGCHNQEVQVSRRLECISIHTGHSAEQAQKGWSETYRYGLANG